MVEVFNEVVASARSFSLRKLLRGVGINDAWYETQSRAGGVHIECPYYSTWRGLLTRVYSEKYQKKRPTYKDTAVCKEWLTFSNFKRWMVKQDWHGKHLDKDILVQGNLLYSPETCCFVPLYLNNLLVSPRSEKSEYPTGVSYCKDRDKFCAYISCNTKHKNLGRYNTVQEAYSIYKGAKEGFVKMSAEAALLNGEIDNKVYRALLTWKVVEYKGEK